MKPGAEMTVLQLSAHDVCGNQPSQEPCERARVGRAPGAPKALIDDHAHARG
jgi:hypothetical protein